MSDIAARIKGDFMFDQTVTPMIFIMRHERIRDMLMAYQLKGRRQPNSGLVYGFLL